MPRFRMYQLRANNVLELHQQRHLIDLNPPYQRLSVWDKAKQQRFIDSVINGVDTPKLYFHETTGYLGSTSRYKFSVIDGKQRLLSLWAFIANELPLPSDFVYFDDDSYEAGGLTYEELLSRYPILRAHFDDFEVPVILVEADNDEFIEQLFWRLNVQVPLSAPESRNVLGGPLPLLIRKVGLTTYFTESVRIKNDRFQHLDLAAKFIYISHSGDFVSTKKANLDNFVKSLKDARERGDAIASEESLAHLEQRIRESLQEARRFFGCRSALLGSVGRMTLYFHVFRLCIRAGVQNPMSLRMLEKFNADVTAARRKSQRMSQGSGEEFEGFEYRLVLFDQDKQSVNDGGALRRQYGHLRDYMNEEFGVALPELE